MDADPRVDLIVELLEHVLFRDTSGCYTFRYVLEGTTTIVPPSEARVDTFDVRPGYERIEISAYHYRRAKELLKELKGL